MSESLKIRKLLPEDIEKAMELVRAEGWNQTSDDWNLLIEGALNICLAAEISGKLVATATAINYSNKVAWIGMVLVNKENRGKGISKVLLNALFESLKSCESIKLDATPAGQPVYKKVGFTNEYLIDRMVNTSFNTDLPQLPGSLVRKIQENDIPAIIEFDKHVFGADRTQLIHALVSNNPNSSWILEQNNTITGFILGRTGNKYQQIGPLSAQSLSDVKILMCKVLSSLKGQAIVIDVLDDKSETTEWLTSIGFEKQRDFTRMYKGENLYAGNILFQYLICGPDLG
jgi:GNAT superfamily N-acetyltransferase